MTNLDSILKSMGGLPVPTLYWEKDGMALDVLPLEARPDSSGVSDM